MSQNNYCLVLEQFLKDPLEKFQLRELSRLTKISTPSLKKYLLQLLDEGLILKERQKNTNYPLYFANRDLDKFKLEKKLFNIRRVQPYIDKIKKHDPSCIVMFGSCAKGVDTADSDIDLYVELPQKELNLPSNIHLIFENDFKKLSVELKENILNGIKLYGYVEVF